MHKTGADPGGALAHGGWSFYLPRSGWEV